MASPAQYQRDLLTQELDGDDYLNELASRGFSSPSDSLRQPYTGPSLAASSEPLNTLAVHSSGLLLPILEREVHTKIKPLVQTLPSGGDPSQLTMPNTRGASRGFAPSSDLDVQVTDVRPVSPEGSTRNRRQPHDKPSQTDTQGAGSASRKRKRPEAGQGNSADDDRPINLSSDDSPFGGDMDDKAVEVIDLGDAEDVPALGAAPKKDDIFFKNLPVCYLHG